MSKDEQLAFTNTELWAVVDPIEQLILELPQAPQYYGGPHWDSIVSIAKEDFSKMPHADLMPHIVQTAASLEIDAISDASARAQRLVTLMRARGIV